MKENTKANGDYGYFGKGDTGYAQYMTAFNRNFGGSSGSGGGIAEAFYGMPPELQQETMKRLPEEMRRT